MKNGGASAVPLSWDFCYASMHRFCGSVSSATQVSTSELTLGSMSMGSSWMLARTSCRLMGEHLFRLYGLNFDSDIPMHAALPGTGIADVTVRLATERPIESNEPPGELMAFTDGGGRRLSTITQTIDTYILRVHGMSDFVISKVPR